MHVWIRPTHFVFRVFTPTSEVYKSDNVIPVDIVQSHKKWNCFKRLELRHSVHKLFNSYTVYCEAWTCLTAPLCTARHEHVFKHRDLIFSSPPTVFSECVNWGGIIGEQTLVKRQERKTGGYYKNWKSPPFNAPTPLLASCSQGKEGCYRFHWFLRRCSLIIAPMISITWPSAF